MRITKHILLLIFISVFSCKDESLLLNTKNISYLKKTIKHDYLKKKYFQNENKISLTSIQYFYNNKLVEQVGDEYRLQYFYDTNDKLVKINNCRFNNCENGYWEFMKYDNKGNLIGSFLTSDSIVNLDTVKVEQVKFYDSDNNLVKELIRKGKKVNYDKFEVWRIYTYKNENIYNEFEIRNTDTIWKNRFFYDKKNRLTKIYRKHDSITFNETFEYNNLNNLIKKISIGKDNSTKGFVYTSATPHNNIIEYSYEGQELIEQKTLNLQNKIIKTEKYIIEKTSTNANNQ